MNIQDALYMYNLPFVITGTTSGSGFVTYQLQANGASATLNRLSSRLNDLISATGEQLEIIQGKGGIRLRAKQDSMVFDWFDYNGYADFSDPSVPYIVGMGNNGIVTDTLDHAPHMLVSGTTGSGKSVFLHTLVTTLICNPINNVYIVDCKRVEFNMYKKYALVVSDVFGEISAARVTDHIVQTMHERYKLMEQLQVNNFSGLLKKIPDTKRIVLVVDELAELLQDKKSKQIIAPRLLSIAQLGRAAGIHLVCATQRPDTKIINGTLKANIPTRVCFHSITNTDSRVILDRGGAENLTGNGDMLYLRNGAQQLERIQGLYIDPDKLRNKL